MLRNIARPRPPPVPQFAQGMAQDPGQRVQGKNIPVQRFQQPEPGGCAGLPVGVEKARQQAGGQCNAGKVAGTVPGSRRTPAPCPVEIHEGHAASGRRGTRRSAEQDILITEVVVAAPRIMQPADGAGHLRQERVQRRRLGAVAKGGENQILEAHGIRQKPGDEVALGQPPAFPTLEHGQRKGGAHTVPRQECGGAEGARGLAAVRRVPAILECRLPAEPLDDDIERPVPAGERQPEGLVPPPLQQLAGTGGESRAETGQRVHQPAIALGVEHLPAVGANLLPVGSRHCRSRNVRHGRRPS